MSKNINIAEAKDTKVVDLENVPVDQTPTEPEAPKGKDMKILGMKVHVEKAEKKAKKVKEPKEPKQKLSKKKLAAGIGGGLLIVGAAAKGAYDVYNIVAKRNANQMNACEDDVPFIDADCGGTEMESQSEPDSAEADENT